MVRLGKTGDLFDARSQMLEHSHPLTKMWRAKTREDIYMTQNMSGLGKRTCLLIVCIMAFSWSCSRQDEDQAKQTAQEIEDKTKEIAGEAAEKTREVAGEVVDKSKQIVSATGEAITDGWITAKVRAKFADDKVLKDSDLTVETDGRVVTLKGTVPSSDAKKRAVMIAGGTEGVLSVVDQVTVKTK